MCNIHLLFSVCLIGADRSAADKLGIDLGIAVTLTAFRGSDPFKEKADGFGSAFPIFTLAVAYCNHTVDLAKTIFRENDFEAAIS